MELLISFLYKSNKKGRNSLHCLSSEIYPTSLKLKIITIAFYIFWFKTKCPNHSTSTSNACLNQFTLIEMFECAIAEVFAR